MCLNTLCPFVSNGIAASVVTGSSTISNQLEANQLEANQLEAGSIIVRHIQSISVPSLLLIVYGLIGSTHKVSQGFVMTSYVGRFPYLCSGFFNVTSTTVFLTCNWMVFIIPVQYIAVCNVSLRHVCSGCCQ